MQGCINFAEFNFMVSVWYDHVLLTIKDKSLRVKKLQIFFFTLINFNYIDLNIQIADKLTIKIDKKKLKTHKIWIIRSAYAVLRAQHSRHGVQHNWVRQVNHSEVRDGQQTLTHFYSTESRNQASRPVTTLVVKTKKECMICLS